jgi:hypothetical protein
MNERTSSVPHVFLLSPPAEIEVFLESMSSLLTYPHNFKHHLDICVHQIRARRVLAHAEI